MENQDLTGVVSGTSKDKQKDVSLASSTTASQFGSTGPRSDVSKELKNDQGLWVLPCPKDSPRPWVFIGFHPPKSLYSSALVPLGTKVPGILHEVASLAYHFSQWTQEDFYEEQVEPCIEPPVSQPPFGVQLSDSEFIPQGKLCTTL